MTKLIEELAVKSLVSVDTGLADGKELIFSKEKFAEAIVFRIMERIDTEIGTALDQDEAYAAATLQALALTILDEFDMEVPGDDDWDAEAELQKIIDEFEQGSGI